MSIDKVPPLDQAKTDAVAMRAVNGRGGEQVRTPPPFPPPVEAAEGASHLFDSLALPLPESTAAGAPTARVGATYRMEAARGLIETLEQGRLPEGLIRLEVVTLIRHVAEARETDVVQLIETVEETAPERLPSANGTDSHFAFRGRLSAMDEDGKLRLFDLYLTRVSARQWEAAVFERDPSRASQTFPRPAPPVEVHRLLIDPASALVLACVAQPTPLLRGPAGRDAFAGGAMRALVYAAVGLVTALLVVRGAYWLAAVVLFTAALPLVWRR